MNEKSIISLTQMNESQCALIEKLKQEILLKEDEIFDLQTTIAVEKADIYNDYEKV